MKKMLLLRIPVFGGIRRKWLFAMKNFILLFFVFSLNLNANIMSQARVSLDLTDVNIKTLINEIESQTELGFLYNLNEIKGVNNISVEANEETVKEILDRVLENTGLTYELDRNVIVIKPNPIPVQSQDEGKRKLIGTITDDTKVTLPGVSIVEKGTSNGVSTDFDGNFSLEIPENGSITLLISFIGMESQEVVVTNQERLDIVMSSSSEQLNEVVVTTGYQKIDRKLFTGSAQKLNADDIKVEGAPDITSSLQGKATGVQVSNVSSTFGAAPVITIRGNSSINGNNKPLWVVDGVELEDLVEVSADDLTSGNLTTLLSSGVAGLNPEDIADFQILKDVSATALYGAKAMNGVIVITTKQGKEGRMSVNYTGSVSIKDKPQYSNFDIMDSGSEMSVYRQLSDYGWVDMTTVARAENFGVLGKMYDGINNGTVGWGPNGGLNENFLEPYGKANTDWFDHLFQNGVTQQHSFSLSGGTKNSSYYASMSYYNDAGYTIADNVDKYTAALRLQFKPTDKLSVGIKLSANVRDQKVPGTKNRSFDVMTGEYTRDFDINPFSYALNSSRSMRAYDDKGDLEYFRRSFAPFNIIHELRNNFVNVEVKDITFQTDLEYALTSKINLRSTFQMRRATTMREHKIHETSNQAEAYRADGTQSIIDANKLLFKDPANPNSNAYSILPEGGFLNVSNDRLSHYYIRNSFDWSPRLGEDHIMNIFLGNEVNITNREGFGKDIWGISYDKGGVVSTHPDLQRYLNALGQGNFPTSLRKDRRASVFTTAAYTYQGKYIVNGSFRYDGSNQLGESTSARFLPSWTASGAWNIHAESFMEDVTFVNHLKTKASYGYNGIMGPNTSAALAMFSGQTLRPTDNETYYYVAALDNEDLTWEKMYELNLGIDFALFNNKIAGEIGYYNRKSIDLIDVVSTSGVGGHQLKYGNIGDMKSHGWEFMLNTTNIKTNDFSWTTNFNWNYHTSEITKLENTASISEAISNIGVPLKGYSHRSLFSVRFAGLDSKGIPTFYGENDEVVYDINLQNREDITKVLKNEGSLAPKFYGGLTNNFKYKNFTLGVGIVYKWGNVIRLDDAFKPNYTDYDSFSKELANRWMIPGDETRTNIPAILDKRTYDELGEKNAYSLYNKSTERVAKGDFIRLKDVSLRYQISPSVLNKINLKSGSLSFQASNLCLLYSDDKLNGIDPEFYSSGGVSMPTSRMYTFTLNLGF
ncbi:SusC/RagA family TonB-linked outer membrane protein [Ancylomarina euxinus]|uniref:SusC/RagA family TonB-linked outer membrane protein n=1 Tax=Ancylomarina euxinus TaxID=2283627 RepID=A0A425XY69_9BACT|nr:SusC/RagA family TonB-linked outer membrane protein [Ancylomarina euxinus]MCZ4695946.1 SusC/RagA family TonB-linked outer membrane protein [Ancylomarina euxinus]MUP16318.1 SusC/RagA family TonB-linked outer membrane protein [Ancylomarina euxinus]RRG19714.1 SusC/RagA family TonB-linked outer membrane protein [Ancylomarina euxinus]